MPGPIDAELLGRLLDEHGPALALYASQWTDAADDCVQEALIELAGTRVAAPSPLRAQHRNRQELLAWFASPDRSWPFSFENICDAIDLDPAQVRAGLRILSLASTRCS